MKNKLIIGNWKSNKTSIEVVEWFDEFAEGLVESSGGDKKIILLPSFTLLTRVMQLAQDIKLPVHIGVQNISPFPNGAYTGEVNAGQAKEFADYVMIGHSERRRYFFETDELLAQKVKSAKEVKLKIIYCVENELTPIPDDVDIVAYEPVEAIGTGSPDTPESAEAIAKAIKTKHPFISSVLYGGSITSQNVASFTKMDNIDGVLVGNGSLSAGEFIQIINNA